MSAWSEVTIRELPRVRAVTHNLKELVISDCRATTWNSLGVSNKVTRWPA